MNQVHISIREARSEILIFMDKNMPDDLSALEEASKILQREVLRAKFNLDCGDRRKSSSY